MNNLCIMDVWGWLSTNRGHRKQMSCSCKLLDSLSIQRMRTHLLLGLKVVPVSQEMFEDTLCSPLTGHTWPRSWLSTNTASSRPSWLSFRQLQSETYTEISVGIQPPNFRCFEHFLYYCSTMTSKILSQAHCEWYHIGLKMELLLLIYTSRPISKG